jgi:hypothetical protein
MLFIAAGERAKHEAFLNTMLGSISDEMTWKIAAQLPEGLNKLIELRTELLNSLLDVQYVQFGKDGDRLKLKHAKPKSREESVLSMYNMWEKIFGKMSDPETQEKIQNTVSYLNKESPNVPRNDAAAVK